MSDLDNTISLNDRFQQVASKHAQTGGGAWLTVHSFSSAAVPTRRAWQSDERLYVPTYSTERLGVIAVQIFLHLLLAKQFTVSVPSRSLLGEHGKAMNGSTYQSIRPNVSASSPFGSSFIFLQEEPWYYSNKTKDWENVTGSSPDGVEALSLPGFSDNARAVVAVYCVLFSVAAVGNLSVFLTLLRARHRKSRVSLLMTHLAAADLIVTFVMIPLEVGWRVTTQWLAGNLACKLFLFMRAFGLYLSSNILVCISLDRYFAIIYPLKVSDARRRSKLMLSFAWFTSLLCSVPQVLYYYSSPGPGF